jgi:catecholate siderophore receptor
MPNMRFNWLATTALGIALAGGADVSAQVIQLPQAGVEAEPSEYLTTEPAISTKMRAPIQDTPRSITVINKEVMEDQGMTRMRDMLRMVPGMGWAGGEGGHIGDVPLIRGFEARGDIYMDGIRDIGAYNRDSFNVDAFEVVKGPSSILFGRGTTGGMINQVTKTPKPGSFNEANVALGAGAFTRGNEQAFSERMTGDVNHDFNNGSAARINVMGEKSDVPGRDITENERFGIAPSYVWGLNGDTQLTVSALHQQENNVPDYGIPFLRGKPAPVDYSTYYGLKGDWEENMADIATAQIKHRFEAPVQLVNTTRYGRFDRDARATAAQCTSAGVCTRNMPGRDNTWTQAVNQTDLLLDFQTGDLLTHALSTGIEFNMERLSQRSLTSTLNGTSVDLFNPNHDAVSGTTLGNKDQVRTFGYATYVNDQVKIGDYFEVVGGVRWENVEGYSKRQNSTGATTSSFYPHDEMLSYAAAGLFKPEKGHSYYLSYGTSFNPTAEFFTVTASDTAPLDPEKNESYELGAKYELLDGALALRGAIFRIEKTNARVNDPSNTSLDILAGKQRADGFEVEAVGRINSRWQVQGGYTFLSTEQIKTNDPSTEGREMIRTPDHAVSLWTTYRLTPEWRIGGGAFYVGQRYSNTTNTNSVDDYIRFDAMAAYALTEDVDLQLNVYNLLDEDYIERVYNNWSNPGPGRSVILTTNIKF